MKKKRIDKIMFERGLVDSRTKAQALIMSGQVFKNQNFSVRFDKPGELIAASAPIFIKENLPYVSRGGVKLKGAFDHFKIEVQNKIALDIGASTGGFTDCLLQEGASFVYALDVGKNQLHEKIRNNKKVAVIENTNFRTVQKNLFAEKIDIAVIDVSFISLKLIFSPLAEILEEGAQVVALIKPQFEVGRGETVKGIVKDVSKREKARDEIINFAKKSLFSFKGQIESPIKGGSGNTEYLAYFLKI